jgi:hypothetical protein
MPEYRGCVPRDSIPALLPNQFCVINLDESGEPGTHWTCLMRCSELVYYYFDSFGQLPLPEVIRASGVPKNILVSQDEPLQDIHADSCGWWVLLFIDFITRDRLPNAPGVAHGPDHLGGRAKRPWFGFADFVKLFIGSNGNDPQKNELIMRRMIKTHAL